MKKIFIAVMISAAIAVLAATQNAALSTNAPAVSAPATVADLFPDPVIVKGKGIEIKRSALDQVLTGAKANAAAQGQSVPPDLEVQILNQLIYVQVMLQKANDADRAAGKQEADAQLKKIIANFASAEAFDRQLKAVGMTKEDLLAKATQEAVAKATLRRELNVTVADADVKDYYNNNPAAFEVPEKVSLADILILTINPSTRAPLSTEQQQAKRKKIDEALKLARSGENFSNLVVRFSEDTNAKDTGGELPDLARDQLPTELASAAFSLTNSQVSDVIETAYGYYILKLRDKTPAKKLAMTDKVPPSETTVAEDIKTFLTRQQIQKQAPDYVGKMKKEYDVQILDPGLKTLEAALEAAATNAPAATLDK